MVVCLTKWRATNRFSGAGEPGWVTDRGMVFITLGDPDRVDSQTNVGIARRAIQWSYRAERGEDVVLDSSATRLSIGST